MKLKEWWGFYSKIIEEFSFDPEKDYCSSVKLSNLLDATSKTDILEFIRGRDVAVCGSGANLVETIDLIDDQVTIVADSAIGEFYERKGCPDIIVSDLDGDIGTIGLCAEKGTVVVVHAHGDNSEKLSEIGKRITGKMVGTTQNIPLWNVFNFGGFTDGDRSAFLADHFGAATIKLYGFDFDSPNPSKLTDIAIKRKKLLWARKLLNSLAASRGSTFREGKVIEI